jgi:hypothetical protein
MAIGIRNFYKVAAAGVTVSASVTLVTTGLTSPIAAGQTQHIHAWIPFTVGATGGVRFQIVTPSATTSYEATFILYDTITPAITTAIQSSNTAFTNALAQAGSHFIRIEATVVNGVNAGNLDIQVACNTAANGITVLGAAVMDVVKL